MHCSRLIVQMQNHKTLFLIVPEIESYLFPLLILSISKQNPLQMCITCDLLCKRNIFSHYSMFLFDWCSDNSQLTSISKRFSFSLQYKGLCVYKLILAYRTLYTDFKSGE